MAPPPALSIAGISWRIELRTPHTLMSKMRRYSASVACSSEPFHSTPALLNAMSSGPNLATAKFTIAFTSASLATSARTNAASPPSFLISATTCAPSFSRRPLRTTFAPTRANAIAVALPMPDVPPVTSATLLVNELFILFLSFLFVKFSALVGELCSLPIANGQTSSELFGLIRQQAGIRAERERRAVLRAAIHKLRKSGTCRQGQPIRDVLCARLRAPVAEVERMRGLGEERIEKCPFS